MKSYAVKFKYIVCAAALIAIAAVSFLQTGAARADTVESAPDIPVITITANGKRFTYKDEKIEPTDFTVAEEIRKRRINAPLKEKIELVDRYLSKGANYKTALNTCFPLLERTVNKVADFVFIPSEDADVEYKNKRFTTVAHKNGRELDEDRLYASIYYNLKYAGGGTVAAPLNVTVPSVKLSDIKEELNVISRYTTEYTTSAAGRAHNVALAIEKFDGLEIPPGESLSFNKTVGERTEKNGFKSAKIIVDGKYTDGVGGGVCQASTAVYNAALMAGLSCSANAHSICPSYCPPGLDAMISSVSDLVITNTTGRTVRISTVTNGKTSSVRFYGVPTEFDIEPESVVVKRIEHAQTEQTDTEHKYFPSDAVSGDRQLVALGKDGYVSETYLKYYKNGELVKRVKIRTNEYKAVPQVIAVAP